jgi:hypothetical protein
VEKVDYIGGYVAFEFGDMDCYFNTKLLVQNVVSATA